MHILYSAQARADLDEIWFVVASNGGIAVADKIIDRLERRVSVLTRHPHMGPARPDIAEEARILVVERWLVLYKADPDTIKVIRVLDGARDLKQITLGKTFP